ncbi:MAG: DUF3440 domain-containing protein [Bacilli bacterium]|jgi:predicted phosphoadenosine phosphosulfate sulfurtransferase
MSGKKIFLACGVDEALEKRLDLVFSDFDNICVSFSGGKDSGLLLNAVLEYKRRHGCGQRIAVFHEDYEAQYSMTTEYVTRMYEANIDDIEPYWFCVPMTVNCSVSMHQLSWVPWNPAERDIWVRPLPEQPYVISLEHDNVPDFYRLAMTDEALYEEFGKWYARTHPGRSIVLLGIRANESLNRYAAITNDRKTLYRGQHWTRQAGENYYVGHPIYDWEVEDVWVANGRRGYDYNRLYDLYYKAGLTLSQMRVASPYNIWGRATLNLYRVIDPEVWVKVVGRVQGANFAAIYGDTKALGYREIKLPKGHTWESYCKFLLSTLPQETRNHYLEKFETSIKFWKEKGGVVSDEAIAELEACRYPIEKVGPSVRSKHGRTDVRFAEIPDDTDDVKSTIDIPSWKRMTYCILKNDHTCKWMGFGPTKKQSERIKEIIEKYRSL